MASVTDNTKRVEALIRELDAQREAYLQTFQKVNDLLAANLAATVPKDTLRTGTPPLSELQRPRVQSDAVSGATSDREAAPRHVSTGLTFETSSKSRSTGLDSDHDDDEAYYVQETLQPQSHEMEGMRSHIRAYKWDEFGKKIMDGVVGNPARLSETPLIPNRKGKLEDRSDYTHYQVFDVGSDGSPLSVEFPNVEKQFGRPMAIWNAIKEINPPSKQRHAVGRITILREPSPILFGAIHHTMNSTFYVDELFRHLVESDGSCAKFRRAFEDDERKQRSFVFNFEYFTLIGKDCEPMKWQMAAGQEDRKPGHIQISRCSSVVALHLSGQKIKEVRNPSRRARTEKGAVYDPFSPWQVLNLQCCPDYKARMDIHDSSKHYVNGIEAFMTTVLGEYRDAKRRFDDITDRISKRVRPPLEFMFSSDIRDKLLFENEDYSMSRRYFWAHQTLGIMNESIKALVDAYEDEFTDDVWEGKHKTVWPMLDEHSSRNTFYKRRMAKLRQEFDIVVQQLKNLIAENNGHRKEVNALKEDLFTGTSIEESRKSVKATETTVQQGHNIKLLTLVSIFFLPLTFVTSIFGMTNMPQRHDYRDFAIVAAVVCVPFFILIGSLNTTRGMNFWRMRTKAVFIGIGAFFSWLARGGKEKEPGLLSAKSFETTTSASRTRSNSWMLTRRTSTEQRQRQSARARARASTLEDADELSVREGERELQRKVEDGPPPGPVSPKNFHRRSHTVATEPASRLADLWLEERNRRRLRYREDI